MLSTDCAYCGAVNQAPARICFACGDDLALQPLNRHDQSDEWEPLIDPNHPVLGSADFGVDTALSETLSLCSSQVWLITKIVLVTVTPFEIFRAFNMAEIPYQWELTIWSYVLSGACKVLVVPALIYALMKVILKGEDAGVQESYRWGLTKLGKLAICAIIVGVLEALGYALLIIPGIIVSLVFVLVYPIAVLEKGSVSEVFGRSIELVRGHWLQVFLAWVVVGVFILISSVFSAFIIEVSSSWMLSATVAIVGDILNQGATVLSLVLYLSLPRPSLRSGGPTTVLSLN